MGTLRAAEELYTPVIIQLAEARFKTAPLELMGPMMVHAAKEAKVEVAVHLDHGCTVKAIKKALELGFTSVMYDGSALPFEENADGTQAVRAMAAGYGADVEAELGLVGRSEGGDIDYGIRCTIPGDARVFVEQTGVEALAVAIGNQHGNYPSAPRLRFDILKDIHRTVPEEHLVLHGGSGISDEDFKECIRNGITKVNIATAVLDRMTFRAKEYLEETEHGAYYGMSQVMEEGAYEVVKHHINVFNMKNL